MDERLWIFEYAWIGAGILIVLIFIVSALIGLAARNKSDDH